MGTQISAVLDELELSTEIGEISMQEKTGTRLPLNHIPELLVDNTDRNRTSPFAFTGNKFEFRAVGSSANCASAMLALNTAMAGQLLEFRKDVDALIASGTKTIDAVFAVVRRYISESKPVRFDGNGYSEEWKEEAKKRGLDCEMRVPYILDAYLNETSEALFAKTQVLTPVELHARNEVKWEQYTKKVQIEARVLGDLAMNHIIPVATRYQGLLLDNVYKIQAVYDKDKVKQIAGHNLTIIEDIAEHIGAIKLKVDEMVEARKAANKIESEREKSIAYCETIVPYLEDIRYHIDKLELMVDNEMWTLPKYRELLFIR